MNDNQTPEQKEAVALKRKDRNEARKRKVNYVSPSVPRPCAGEEGGRSAEEEGEV
jgi:hypothetical protein